MPRLLLLLIFLGGCKYTPSENELNTGKRLPANFASYHVWKGIKDTTLPNFYMTQFSVVLDKADSTIHGSLLIALFNGDSTVEFSGIRIDSLQTTTWKKSLTYSCIFLPKSDTNKTIILISNNWDRLEFNYGYNLITDST